MQKWIIPANEKLYDYASAFAKWGYIDWRQKVKYEIGDEVYIYCSKPHQKVMYRTFVEKVNMSFDDCTDDREFWYDIEEYKESVSDRYIRLRLIDQVNKEELSLEYLQMHGIKAAPQSPMRASDELAAYMDKYI